LAFSIASSSAANLILVFVVVESIGTATDKLPLALINILFPLSAEFALSSVKKLALLKSYFVSFSDANSRYIAPPNYLALHLLNVVFKASESVVLEINIPYALVLVLVIDT
jgi:hypothetical protein